jgi:hypothetical protein
LNQSHSGKQKVEETPKSSEVLTQELEASLSDQLSPQALAHLKAYIKQGPDIPFDASHPCWYLKYNRATTIYRDWYSHYIIDTSTIQLRKS